MAENSNSAGNKLMEALAKLAALRGPPERWVKGEVLVSRHIAALGVGARVFCRGEVRLDKGHFPAALVYDRAGQRSRAWAPSGEGGEMEAHHEDTFYSRVPHEGIAREVLSDGERVTVAAPATGE